MEEINQQFWIFKKIRETGWKNDVLGHGPYVAEFATINNESSFAEDYYVNDLGREIFYKGKTPITSDLCKRVVLDCVNNMNRESALDIEKLELILRYQKPDIKYF